MRKQLALACLMGALGTLFAAFEAGAAEGSHPFSEYRVIDGGRLWVQVEGDWRRLRLAHVDAPFGGGNRPMARRLPPGLAYTEIRNAWVGWIRQVAVLSGPAQQALEKRLAKAKKRLWRKVAEPPARRSHTQSGTYWVRIELDGDDLGQSLVGAGWAIPWLPPGMTQPDDWDQMGRAMGKAMAGCKGLWQTVLASCVLPGTQGRK